VNSVCLDNCILKSRETLFCLVFGVFPEPKEGLLALSTVSEIPFDFQGQG
jgi:hypothetical protein